MWTMKGFSLIPRNTDVKLMHLKYWELATRPSPDGGEEIVLSRTPIAVFLVMCVK